MRVAKPALTCGLVFLIVGAARAGAQPAAPCSVLPSADRGANPPVQCTATPTSPTPTQTSTQSPTPTQTQTPTVTRTPSKTRTPVPTITFEPPPTDTPPPTIPPVTPPTVTVPPTATLPPTNTPKPSASATKAPSATATATRAPTSSPTPKPSTSATATPNQTKTSTPAPSQTPTSTPAPPPPSPTPTFTPTVKPPPDPCVMPKDPPGPGANKRWYAIGVTTTDMNKPWFGGSVEWTNQNMWTLPGADQFVDETLWVTVHNAAKCWIETGDGESTDGDTGLPKRAYYWAENKPGPNGYEEYPVNGVPYPPVGQFQRYTIFHQIGGAYVILIGGKMVGVSEQPGETLQVHVGLETTTPVSRVRGAVRFRNFLVHDGWEFVPWPNHTQSVDPPAWWIWNWPTAMNGIPRRFLPRADGVPFQGDNP